MQGHPLFVFVSTLSWGSWEASRLYCPIRQSSVEGSFFSVPSSVQDLNSELSNAQLHQFVCLVECISLLLVSKRRIRALTFPNFDCNDPIRASHADIEARGSSKSSHGVDRRVRNVAIHAY
ncbi:hypothetical protein BD309DRAFT_26997 [Dichomitus squalens]|nr:hypothetical protein BD309DRAFT_26997 [Dichomitus squalens]